MFSQLKLIAVVAAAIGPAMAIPPESFGFPSAPNDTALTVAFNNNGNITSISEAELLGVDIPAPMPTVAVDTATYRSLASYNGSYMVIMVDPDASTPQNPSSRFLLHWAQPDMQPATSSSMSDIVGQPLSNMSAPFVPYMRPAPPTTSDPHRYILYAFEQPANFTVPAAFSGFSDANRTRFNVTEFASEANLGAPAAANYYFCSNKTAVPANFIGKPGSSYPGGNGAAVTDGPGPSPSSSGSASSGSASATAAATPSGTAASGSASATTAAAVRALDAGSGASLVLAAFGAFALYGL